jgi:hypothetical protein
MLPTQYATKMHDEVTTRFEYDPMLEETMTRPMVKPIDWQLARKRHPPSDLSAPT